MSTDGYIGRLFGQQIPGAVGFIYGYLLPEERDALLRLMSNGPTNVDSRHVMAIVRKAREWNTRADEGQYKIDGEPVIS
jgi:hypothetical protein